LAVVGFVVGTLALVNKLPGKLDKQFRDDAVVSNEAVLAETDSASEMRLRIAAPSEFAKRVIFEDDVEIKGKLTSPDVINSISAGDGIEISAGQAPTITNTDRGSDQKIWNEIIVSGQTTLAPATNTSPLTFAGSGGVSVSTDASTNKITISASSSDLNISGWTDGGSSIYLSSSTDSVGIGTSSPSYKLHVAGTGYFSGGLTLGDALTVGGASAFSGNVTLGDSSSDTITFNARIANGTSLLPDTDMGSDLGSADFRFNNLWVANINSNSSASYAGQTTFTYEPADATLAEASVLINPTAPGNNGILLGFARAGYTRAYIDAEGDLSLGYADAINPPSSDYPLNIYGHSGTRVAYVDTTGNLNISGDLNLGGTIISGGGSSFTGNITMADDTWIGLGESAGRIVFDDQDTDDISIMNANVGIGTVDPSYRLDVRNTGLSGNDASLQRLYADVSTTGNRQTGLLITYLGNAAGGLSSNIASGVRAWKNSLNDSFSSFAGFYSGLAIGHGTNGPQTGGSMVGFFADTPAFYHESSALTNYYGLYIDGDADSRIVNKYGLYVGEQVGSTSNYAVYTAGSTPSYFGGNVGIGTDDPSSLLHIVQATGGNGEENRLTYDGSLLIGRFASGSQTVRVAARSSAYDSILQFGHGLTGHYGTTTNIWTFTAGGNTSSNLVISGDGGLGTDDFLTIEQSGDIGIGTTGPDRALEINQSSGNNLRLTYNDSDGSAQDYTDFTLDSDGNLTIYSTTDGGSTAGTTTIDGALKVDLPGTGTSYALCHTTQEGVDGEEIVDCTSSPQADIAEMYAVERGITYGEVVAIGEEEVVTTDGAAVRKLIRTDTPYQANVIGIVSNNYGDFSSVGYNIKSEDNPLPIALAGRVPVKVASTSEPILPGDFVTTSSQPGKIMRATQSGFVIGKALDSWEPEEGSKEIVIFVNMSWFEPFAPEKRLANLEDEVALMRMGISPLQQEGEEFRDSLTITSLTVIDDAVLGDVTITGELAVGTLVIDGMQNSINATGVLRLQPMALGSIEFMGGTLEIDKEGNFKISEGKIIGNSSFRDTITIAAGEKTVKVERDWDEEPVIVNVTPSYKTFVWVTDKSEDGFIINVDIAPVKDAEIDWFAVW